MAATNFFDATLAGVGGHAAMPHLAVDPIPAAAAAVQSLQVLLARETGPFEAGVVSVTKLQAGDAYNVVPSTARLGGTIRSLTLAGRERLEHRLRETLEHTVRAHRCELARLQFDAQFPPVVNDEAAFAHARDAVVAAFGAEAFEEPAPTMGGEDFAFFLERVPGCFLFLGTGTEAKGTTTSVHHPQFDIDEDAIPLGTALHATLATRALTRLSS
jgi:amidohydrolase